MDRCVVYLFKSGEWMLGVDYNPLLHKCKGGYHEVILGRGWSNREISEMLKDYYSENVNQIDFQ